MVWASIEGNCPLLDLYLLKLIPMQELLAFNQHGATEEWTQFPTPQLNLAVTKRKKE